MDIFVEQLVTKKKTAGSYARIWGGIIGAILLLWLFFAVLYPIVLHVVPMMGAFAFLACVGLIYLLYLLIVNTNLEYEYCFTNGAMDVDKIINRRNRKRMAELNARKIERMAKIGDAEFCRLMKDRSVKKMYACSDCKDSDTYYVYYENDKGKNLLLFNPNDKIRDSFRRFNPQKVFLNDEKRY